MQHPPIFAFDFSTIKPAMWALIDNNLSVYIWPSEMKENAATSMEYSGVNVHIRNLPHIKDKSMDESELICEHVKRAQKLAILITDDMDKAYEKYGDGDPDWRSKAIVANEGFAFNAKGDAILELSGYKYLLMAELYRRGYRNFPTYSPITIKKTAGCSKKENKGKDKMIEALSNENPDLHPFINNLHTDPQIFKAKTAFVPCVDDIADAYWCLRTVLQNKEIEGVTI